MAQRTREQLNTANAALFVNNSTGDITPALEKAFNEDVNDSAVNIKGDTFAADAEFAFQNGSKFREGAITHGFGGGIARVCANEKADQWEDGFRYLISTSGSTNTVVYCENINNDNPSSNDDEDFSFAVGSRWKNLVSGNEYICTQANEGDAIWIPISTDSAYNIVTKAEFDALVTASSLIGGQWYNVTTAYTNSAYGDMDVIAVATSGNTIEQQLIWVRDEALTLDNWLPAKTYDIVISDVTIVGGNVKLTSSQAFNLVSGFLGGMPVYVEFGGDKYYTNILTGGDAVSSGCYKVEGSSNGKPIVFGTFNNTFDSFIPLPTLYKFDLTLTDTTAIQQMHSNPITLVDGDGYSYVQLLSATIIINNDGTQDYDFTGYMGIISDIDGNYRAYTGSVTINNGSGNVDIHRTILNEPIQNNLLMYSKAGTDNNEGGLALTVFGTDATQGDHTIRVYGTYVNIPHNL
jgi:hypothetical protein